MNTAQLLDYTIHLYKKCFLRQIGLSVCWMLMYLVFVFIVAAIFVASVLMGTLGAGIAFEDYFSGRIGMVIAAAFLFMFIVFTLQYGQIITNISIAKQENENERMTTGQTFKLAFLNIPRLLTVSFASVLMLIPAAFPVGIMILQISKISGYSFSGVNFAVLIVCLIVTWIIILVADTLICVCVPVAVYENRYFFGAVAKSVKLVKKDFWKILGVHIMFYFAVIGIQYSFTGIFSVLSAVFIWTEGFLSVNSAPHMSSLSMIGNLLSIMVGVITAPLSGIITYVIYVNQKIKYEGYDIELTIKKLEKA